MDGRALCPRPARARGTQASPLAHEPVADRTSRPGRVMNSPEVEIWDSTRGRYRPTTMLMARPGIQMPTRTFQHALHGMHGNGSKTQGIMYGTTAMTLSFVYEKAFESETVWVGLLFFFTPSREEEVELVSVKIELASSLAVLPNSWDKRRFLDENLHKRDSIKDNFVIFVTLPEYLAYVSRSHYMRKAEILRIQASHSQEQRFHCLDRTPVSWCALWPWSLLFEVSSLLV